MDHLGSRRAPFWGKKYFQRSLIYLRSGPTASFACVHARDLCQRLGNKTKDNHAGLRECWTHKHRRDSYLCEDSPSLPCEDSTLNQLVKGERTRQNVLPPQKCPNCAEEIPLPYGRRRCAAGIFFHNSRGPCSRYHLASSQHLRSQTSRSRRRRQQPRRASNVSGHICLSHCFSKGLRVETEE